MEKKKCDKKSPSFLIFSSFFLLLFFFCGKQATQMSPPGRPLQQQGVANCKHRSVSSLVKKNLELSLTESSSVMINPLR